MSAEVDQSYGDFRARREATVWQRWNRVLVILLLLSVWLVIVSVFVPPYKKLKIGHAEIDKMQAQRDEQQVSLSKQTREVNLLKTDPAYLETIARDRLDLMKEGETVFRIESAAAQADKRKETARRSVLVFQYMKLLVAFLEVVSLHAFAPSTNFPQHS